MKTFIKTIGTVISILLIVIGLTVLITYAAIMIISISGGIYLLTLMYPELFDLSEFDGDNNSIFDEYEKEIKELREENLLLIDRYMTFKSIIRSSNAIDESNKEKYANLYRLIYEEDLVGGKTNSQEPSLDELDRFKEIYN